MSRTPVINVQLDTANEYLERSAAALEILALNSADDATGVIKDYPVITRLLRAGLIKNVLSVGDVLRVNKESALSVTVSGSITATVNEETFVEAIGHSGTASYEFIYDGAAWKFRDESVELSAFGITVTGTPEEGNAVVVHEQASEILFDVAAIDYEVPVNAEREHSITLLTRDLLLYGSIPFNPGQALFAVNAAQFPDGLPAGQYYITLNHGSYGGGTGQDGAYNFTLTQPVPVGGKIKHSTMGRYESNGYTPEKITAGTFTTYGADYAVIEQGIATSSGASGTSLGVATASNPSYKVGDHINFTERQYYGSNNFEHSANIKWLNSAAAGAASGANASWWYPSDEFDMPVKSTLPGFLHGLDPSFVACIGKVRKRTAYPVAEGYGYRDTEEQVWLPSMTEMNLGKNNSISETPVKADGTLATESPMDLYVGSTNEDRIKTHGGAARYWWLRAPHSSHANYERMVNTSGALGNISANSSRGVPAGLALI